VYLLLKRRTVKTLEIKSRLDTHTILIDDEDFDRVNKYVWEYEVESKRVFSKVGNKLTFLERYLLELHSHDGKFPVIFINNNRLDFQKINLRANKTEQKAVPFGNNKYRGVSLNKRLRKFQAYIKRHGKLITLGYFESEEVAAVAYNLKAIELKGDQAILNKVAMTTKRIKKATSYKKRSRNTHKGVSKVGKKFRAYFYKEGKQINVGIFSTENEAVEERSKYVHSI
jgi:hypothetical protein